MRNMNKIMIVAEAGINHNGSLTLAKQLVEIASKAGADAVKFQTFDTDEILTQNTPKLKYQMIGSHDESTQYDLIKTLQLDYREFLEINEHCKKNRIIFLSTPFDSESLKFLVNDIGISCIKIASNEITNGPLLLQAALTNKPIILSTGMSNLSDIETALSVIAFGYLQPKEDVCKENFIKAYCSDAGQSLLREKVTLLHCTSSYPARYQDVNLNAIKTLSTAFGLRVGYSDHTIGIEVAIAAAALGVCIIEKHFTMDKSLEGPDHKMSLSSDELYGMIKAIRNIECATGSGIKKPVECEYEMLEIMRRSLIAKEKIESGEIFTSNNLGAKQPGCGVSPMNYWEYLKKSSVKSYQKNEII